MKVSFATYDAPNDVGGVSTWLQRLLPRLQKSGIQLDVHVMAFEGVPGVNCAFFLENGITYHWIPYQSNLSHATRSLLRLLEKSQPEIYVPNCLAPAYYAAGYAARAGIATVGVLHSDDPFYWGIVEEFVQRSSDFRLSAVVPVSTFLQSELSSVAESASVIVRQIGCGVPIPIRAAAASSSVFRLVYIGRLVEEQKRISDVAHALCSVTESDPRLEAWIIGEGAARQSVEAIIQGRGAGNKVRLLQRVENARIYELLTECHALVLLSDYEGLPTSMLEGMAAGVVPICLDMRSGVRELIKHEVNGLIVKDRSADFFAKVHELHRDPSKWVRLSEAARGFVRQHYSIDDCANQWNDLFQELSERRPGQNAAFRGPRILRLPRPNPKFGSFGLTWKNRLLKDVKYYSKRLRRL